MAIINSVNNFRVKQWGKLKQKQQRDKQKCFIAEGYHLVAEAFKQNCLIEIVTTEANSPFDVPTFQVSLAVMERLSAMAAPPKILGICRQRGNAPMGQNLLLVDQVHHPGNLGTIIRTGVAFQMDSIVMDNAVDVYNPKVVQASQGMLFHINVIKRPLKECIEELKTEGYQIIGTDVRGGTALHNAQAQPKRALLIGNEGEGVADNLLQLCDLKVHIPMDGRCESLNVGVAAGIIMYGLQAR